MITWCFPIVQILLMGFLLAERKITHKVSQQGVKTVLGINQHEVKIEETTQLVKRSNGVPGK